MDVLLVNTPLFENPIQTGLYSEPPPIGLGYIGTALRQHGYEVDLLDAVAEEMPLEVLCQKIQESQPRYLGLNVFSANHKLVERIATSSHLSHVLIGGPAAKPLINHVMQWRTQNQLTVITGEAEHVLPALLGNEVKPSPWNGSKSRSVIDVDRDSSWFPNCIDLPLDRSFFRHDPVHETRWNVNEAHLITSRGCGHDCAFCGAARSINPGQKIRFRSEENIEREIDDICALNPQVDCVRLLDDLFLRNPKFVDRALRIFEPRKIRWRAMAHISGMARANRGIFHLLAQSGCLELFVGIESGAPGRRRLIGKASDLLSTWHVVTNLLSVGVGVKAYFIYGFPGESEAEMLLTYKLATRIADYAQRSPGNFHASAFKFRPYHGTKLYQELVQSGIVPTDLKEDSDLATKRGPTLYSFMSTNYSTATTEKINQYISNTQKLNS